MRVPWSVNPVETLEHFPLSEAVSRQGGVRRRQENQLGVLEGELQAKQGQVQLSSQVIDSTGPSNMVSSVARRQVHEQMWRYSSHTLCRALLEERTL